MKMTQRTINIALNMGRLFQGGPSWHEVRREATRFFYSQNEDEGRVRIEGSYGEVAVGRPPIHPSLQNPDIIWAGYSLDRDNAPFIANLDSRPFTKKPKGYKGSYTQPLTQVTSVSAASEEGGLTFFLEYPNRHIFDPTAPGLVSMFEALLGGSVVKADAKEIVYEFPGGQKVVAISKSANRRFIREHPEIIRENQLFAVWPSDDTEYEAMVREVLLGKGE